MKFGLVVVLAFLSLPVFGTPYAYSTLDSWEQFARMRTPGGGMVQNGGFIRFFMDDREGAGNLFFIDGNYQENGQTPEYVRYHYNFAVQQFGVTEDLDRFDLLTYFTVSEKPYFAGLIHSYQIAGGQKILAAQLYPQDVAHDEQIARVVQVLSQRLRVPGAARIFLATGEQQQTTSVADELTAKGMPALSLAELAARTPVLPLEPGEADGTVRLFPEHPETLTPSDIAVLHAPVATLPPVAAVITVGDQANVSALNWRAREWHAPNLRVQDAAAKFGPYDGQRIHLSVKMGGYKISAARAATGSPPSRTLEWREESQVLRYSQLCPQSSCAEVAAAYGARAAGRGFLAAQGAPVVDGVAVPASWYRRWRADASAVKALASAVNAQARGLHEVLIRLSGHPQDIGDWEGPGRYHAVKVNLDAGEAALAQAIATAYAEVESPLARADRAALGIDGNSVAAGLLIEEAPASALSATVITRIPNVTDVYGYFVAVRKGAGSTLAAAVDEGAAPFLHVENQEPIGWSPLRRFSPALIERPLIQELVKFARPWELAYCQANPDYYPGGDCNEVYSDPHKPNALAIELAPVAGGIVIRDWREFSGR